MSCPGARAVSSDDRTARYAVPREKTLSYAARTPSEPTVTTGVPDGRRALLRGALAAPLLGASPLVTRAVRAALTEPPRRADATALARFAATAAALERLRAAVVMRDGEIVLAEAFRGPPLDRAVNVKSVSKTLVAALLGGALGREVVGSIDATLGEVAPALVPPGADPRVARLTLEDLVTMRAGLERTSGSNYGAWVASANWVEDALSRRFVAAPGGPMLYSTGSFHVLGAALASAAGRDLHALAGDWLGAPLGIEFPPWTRDPQGRYLGGNEMALSPLEMARVGELYRRGGRRGDEQVLPAAWVEASFAPRTRSPWSGDRYGYGWFLRPLAGRFAAYARGYGGQFIHVVPEAGLVVAITSDISRAARGDGYTERLHELVGTLVT